MPEPKAKTINGVSFQISQPYEEGQTLGAAEAKALNQVRAENIGNNTRAKIKEMQEAGAKPADIAAHVAEVDANYVLSVTATVAKRDPVEKEAYRIAKDLVKNHLAETGRKLTVAPEGETDESWGEKVETQVEALASNPEVLKAAKQNIDAKSKQAEKLAEALTGVSV